MPVKSETDQSKPGPNGPAPEPLSARELGGMRPVRPTSFAGQVVAIDRLRGSRPGMRIDSKNPGFAHIVLVLGIEDSSDPGSFDVDAALAKVGLTKRET